MICGVALSCSLSTVVSEDGGKKIVLCVREGVGVGTLRAPSKMLTGSSLSYHVLMYG